MRSLLAAFVLSIPAFAPAARAQSMPAVYLNARDEATIPDSATHYRLVDLRAEESAGYTMREYSLTGVLQVSGTLSSIEPVVRQGLFTWYHPSGSRAQQVQFLHNTMTGMYLAWYEDGRVRLRGEYSQGQRVGRWLSVHRNGQKRSEGSYLAGEPHGQWRYYYNTGQLSAEEELNHGQSVGLRFYNPDGSAWSGLVVRRQMPAFPGGQAALLQYLARNTHYPKLARRKKITGSVHVSYTVDESGHITQVQVVKSLAPEVDNEARRVVASLPTFLPGREYNVPTAMTFTLPIHFAPAFSLFGGEARRAQALPTEACPTCTE